ncbi:Hsp70 family protein [bacterium]|nr:Hsp70 family protein [bacterium]
MILGIDLGTTNSLASIVRNGKIEFVDFGGSKLLPSVVAINGEGNLLVGQTAKNQYYLDPENSVKSIKRHMGSDVQTLLNGKEYLPEEIAGMILRYIKETAEEQFGMKLSNAVITVPAYFSDDQRKATSIAGEIAGFKVERIINEPTAASLSYNYNEEKEIRAIVYDFGGGTFDVSVVNISKNLVEVVSSHGDNHLGGDDIDVEFSQYLADLIAKKYKTTLVPKGQTAHQLLQIAEKSKIELSDHPYYTIVENLYIGENVPPLSVELEICREECEEVLQPFIEKTMKLVHIALSDANLNANDIDQILLVGGTSKIPLITREFEKIFDIAPSESINPDQSVCFGAAIQGAIIEDDNIDSILVDVTPYTFGTRAVITGDIGFITDDDVFIPVIKRNSPLPVSKSEVFYKLHPEQDAIEVEIFQGDSKIASENKFIGSFNVKDLSKKNDSEEILLTMNLDLNGILTVIATEKNTGKRKQIIINNSFNHGDVAKSVNKLAHIFADNTDELQSVVEPNTNDTLGEDKESNKIYIAKTMIDKAESKMELADSDDAKEMKEIITALKKAILSRSTAEIESLTDDLTDILFYID